MTRCTRTVTTLMALALLTACGGEAYEAERAAAYQQAEANARAAAAQTPSPGEVEDAPPAAEAEAAPDPIDLPQFAARENLMKAMGPAARRVSSNNIDEARAAAVSIGEYSLAARHPRFQPEGPEYDALAIDLWHANQQVQRALAPDGDRALLQQAIRAQRTACQACHDAFRVEEG